MGADETVLRVRDTRVRPGLCILELQCCRAKTVHKRMNELHCEKCSVEQAGGFSFVGPDVYTMCRSFWRKGRQNYKTKIRYGDLEGSIVKGGGPGFQASLTSWPGLTWKGHHHVSDQVEGFRRQGRMDTVSKDRVSGLQTP